MMRSIHCRFNLVQIDNKKKLRLSRATSVFVWSSLFLIVLLIVDKHTKMQEIFAYTDVFKYALVFFFVSAMTTIYLLCLTIWRRDYYEETGKMELHPDYLFIKNGSVDDVFSFDEIRKLNVRYEAYEEKNKVAGFYLPEFLKFWPKRAVENVLEFQFDSVNYQYNFISNNSKDSRMLVRTLVYARRIGLNFNLSINGHRNNI